MKKTIVMSALEAAVYIDSPSLGVVCSLAVAGESSNIREVLMPLQLPLQGPKIFGHLQVF